MISFNEAYVAPTTFDDFYEPEAPADDELFGKVLGRLPLGRRRRRVGLTRNPGKLALGRGVSRRKKYLGRAAVYSKSLIEARPLVDGIAWGWASIVERDGVVVVDHQGDAVDEASLVLAAQDFMSNSRAGGKMHAYRAGPDGNELIQVGEIVESLVFSRALKAALGISSMPIVGWLVGYKISDPETRADVASGKLRSFSIGGSGRRTPVETQSFSEIYQKGGFSADQARGEHGRWSASGSSSYSSPPLLSFARSKLAHRIDDFKEAVRRVAHDTASRVPHAVVGTRLEGVNPTEGEGIQLRFRSPLKEGGHVATSVQLHPDDFGPHHQGRKITWLAHHALRTSGRAIVPPQSQGVVATHHPA